MAKASLWLGIIGAIMFILQFFVPFAFYASILFCLLGLILGIVGIIQKTNKGTAIAGTVISGIFLLLNLIFIIWAAALIGSMF